MTAVDRLYCIACKSLQSTDNAKGRRLLSGQVRWHSLDAPALPAEHARTVLGRNDSYCMTLMWVFAAADSNGIVAGWKDLALWSSATTSCGQPERHPESSARE
jgi:hypothetical protein